MAEIYLSDVQLAARYGVHRSTPWRWAKIDPQFRQVWLAHIQEQDLYPARSPAWRKGGGQGPWKGRR